MNTKGATMAAIRDVAAVQADELRAAAALAQLQAVAHVVGAVHWFAIGDAAEWAAVMVLVGEGARRGIALANEIAADTIELRYGSVTIHVQGPTRRAALEDYRRMREQRAHEGGW